MRAIARSACAAALCWTLGMTAASAQPAMPQSATGGCAPERAANGALMLRCAGGVTIVAEDGAQYTLRDRDGELISVHLASKALLLEAPKQRAGRRFEVITPQAIAAVRGTRWAVDAQGAMTSVLVLAGQVRVARRAGGGRVVLGPGDGVDVAAGVGPLTVKRWPEARINALLARLGQ
jgi:ferric-dicitrate binding protein FerR (iron transport regulator)